MIFCLHIFSSWIRWNCPFFKIRNFIYFFIFYHLVRSWFFLSACSRLTFVACIIHNLKRTGSAGDVRTVKSFWKRPRNDIVDLTDECRHLLGRQYRILCRNRIFQIHVSINVYICICYERYCVCCCVCVCGLVSYHKSFTFNKNENFRPNNFWIMTFRNFRSCIHMCDLCIFSFFYA